MIAVPVSQSIIPVNEVVVVEEKELEFSFKLKGNTVSCPLEIAFKYPYFKKNLLHRSSILLIDENEAILLNIIVNYMQSKDVSNYLRCVDSLLIPKLYEHPFCKETKTFRKDLLDEYANRYDFSVQSSDIFYPGLIRWLEKDNKHAAELQNCIGSRKKSMINFIAEIKKYHNKKIRFVISMINIINQLEDGNFKNKIIREVCLEIPFVLFRDENYSILHSHTHANCLLIEDTYYHVNNNFEVTGYSYACGNKSGEIELKEYKLLKRYG